MRSDQERMEAIYSGGRVGEAVQHYMAGEFPDHEVLCTIEERACYARGRAMLVGWEGAVLAAELTLLFVAEQRRAYPPS